MNMQVRGGFAAKTPKNTLGGYWVSVSHGSPGLAGITPASVRAAGG
jgi:hypothetical protein